MADDQAIRKQIKLEKAEFDNINEQEAVALEQELIRKDEFLPICQVANKKIRELFQDYYPPEVLEHMTIEQEKIQALSGSLRTLTKNIIKSSSPLTCLGPKCYSAARCPIQKAGVAPISHPCPIELMLIDQWEADYIEDLGIDKQSKIELDLVNDMVESDLMDWRASHELATNGLFDWNAVGVADNGSPILRKEEAVAIGIKLKFKARKDRVREDLMATRKMRAKFGLSKSLDPSKFAATLQTRYNSIKNAQITDADSDTDENEMSSDQDD